jgi:hypothetical protein
MKKIYHTAINYRPFEDLMEKKVVNIEYEIAAVKVVLKALLLTLTDKQKEIVIQDINKTVNDAYIDHPQYQDVISKTEQYIKKII